eukprot:Platyproteum_vivax@DN1926_c0_g1_i1.p1
MLGMLEGRLHEQEDPSLSFDLAGLGYGALLEPGMSNPPVGARSTHLLPTFPPQKDSISESSRVSRKRPSDRHSPVSITPIPLSPIEPINTYLFRKGPMQNMAATEKETDEKPLEPLTQPHMATRTPHMLPPRVATPPPNMSVLSPRPPGPRGLHSHSPPTFPLLPPARSPKFDQTPPPVFLPRPMPSMSPMQSPTPSPVSSPVLSPTFPLDCVSPTRHHVKSPRLFEESETLPLS